MEFIWTLMKGFIRYFIRRAEKQNIKKKGGDSDGRA